MNHKSINCYWFSLDSQEMCTDAPNLVCWYKNKHVFMTGTGTTCTQTTSIILQSIQKYYVICCEFTPKWKFKVTKCMHYVFNHLWFSSRIQKNIGWVQKYYAYVQTYWTWVNYWQLSLNMIILNCINYLQTHLGKNID